MIVPVYVALLHYPIRNRHGQVVTTAVTNMDIHDIARTCKTFGVKRYFLMTPIEVQHNLVERILGHWRTEKSLLYHPDRFEAVALVCLAKSFQEIKEEIIRAHGEAPEVVLTDARVLPGAMSYESYRKELSPPRKKPCLLVFGTGWGIAEEFYPEVHKILMPIWGPDVDYNHLSVRSAVAIVLDRLFGK